MSKMKRTYTVVQMAGYEGEKVVSDGHTSMFGADKWMTRNYTLDEIVTLHVMIRTDFEDGSVEY